VECKIVESRGNPLTALSPVIEPERDGNRWNGRFLKKPIHGTKLVNVGRYCVFSWIETSSVNLPLRGHIIIPVGAKMKN
jgi:hypothetical protein